MKTEKKIIMYDSDEAASQRTVTGWVSGVGRYWGKNEHMARWEGCTHKMCSCGRSIVEKHWVVCEICRNEKRDKAYLEYPFKQWNGEDLVYCNIHDKFFVDESEIEEFIEEFKDENDGEEPNFKLVLCKPLYPQQIEVNYWEDSMHEEMDNLPKEMSEALDKFNEIIKKQKPFSWEPMNVRTEYVRG